MSNSDDYTIEKYIEPQYKESTISKWMTVDNYLYRPMNGKECDISPGCYTIGEDGNSIFLKRMNVDSSSHLPIYSKDILNKIEKFYNSIDKYKQMNLQHKRGYLLYGPPGNGKTSAIRTIVINHIMNHGVVIHIDNCNNGYLFNKVIKSWNQWDTRLIVVMEDIEELISNSGSSIVLEILDGTKKSENLVYIATTNKIDILDSRTLRPSRLDELIMIDKPTLEDRKKFIQFLNIPTSKKLEQIDFSMAEIKEISILYHIYGFSITDAIEEVKKRKQIYVGIETQ